MATLRQQIGCWAQERRRMEVVLRAPRLAARCGWRWQGLCNRHERLVPGPGGSWICEWKDSSFLTACKMFPRLGGRLLEHVAREHPFTLDKQTDATPVSAILPVRGTDRRAALEFVVRALCAAGGPTAEVLVCEHDVLPRLADVPWPAGARHIFVPAAEGELFNKSKALNAGALAARHPLLLLHDADVWVPSDYIVHCAELMACGGWEAVRPIRFLFLLDERQSRECQAFGSIRGIRQIVRVQQNNPGLSSFVRRDTYLEIGGHDERFTGWGWEDVEFLDRLHTRRLLPGSFLPAIHLWHALPVARQTGDVNRQRLREILAEPVAERIEACRKQRTERGEP
jgi:hypothetical protein